MKTDYRGSRNFVVASIAVTAISFLFFPTATFMVAILKSIPGFFGLLVGAYVYRKEGF